MTKTQKLEKEVLRLKSDLKDLQVDTNRMEGKLNAIDEYLNIDYGIRIFEKHGDDIYTDIVVIKKPEDKVQEEDKVSNFVGRLKRTIWNRKSK